MALIGCSNTGLCLSQCVQLSVSRTGTLPILIIVTYRGIYVTFQTFQVFVVVQVSREQSVRVFLRTIFVIAAGRCVVLHGFCGHINLSFALGIINSQSCVEFQFGQKVHFVINVGITDETLYLTGRLVLFHPSQRIKYGLVYRNTRIIKCFIIPAKISVSRINGQSRVECRCSPDGSRFCKTVVVNRPFRIQINFQVTVKERRTY